MTVVYTGVSPSTLRQLAKNIALIAACAGAEVVSVKDRHAAYQGPRQIRKTAQWKQEQNYRGGKR